jgi:Protein of unknown function DUF262/Protein of unknown function (DUF1524)
MAEQGTCPLGDLLQTKRLSVPFWQRSYAWKSAQINDYWSDVSELATDYPSSKSLAGHNHFMGAIILVGDWKAKALEVLDGQQRLATSTIFLRSIANRLKSLNTATTIEAAEHIENEYLRTLNRVKKTSDIHLHLGKYDDSFFQDYIVAPKFKRPVPTKQSHARIVAAAKKFDEELLGLNEARLLHLFETVTEHFYFLYLVFPDSSDAIEIFEVLNDRGIGLSTEELVRGYILQAAKGDDISQETIVSVWDDIFDLTAEPRGRGFLRHYWISSHDDVKARSLNRVIRTFIDSQSSPKRASVRLTADLLDASQVYSRILAHDFTDTAIASRVETLVDLGAVATFPALLSAFRTYNLALKSDKAKVLEILNLLIVAFVRHRIVGQLDNSAFETAAFKFAPAIAARDFAKAELEVIRSMPRDPEFLAAFKSFSIKQATQAHYLLRRIEAYKNPPNQSGIATRKDATLEHIYAQKSKAVLSSHADLINRFGNLTLIGSGPNSSMGNVTFAKKRARFAVSPFWITKQLAKYKTWDETAIAKRQGDLADIAVKIWTFDDLATTKLPR